MRAATLLLVLLAVAIPAIDSQPETLLVDASEEARQIVEQLFRNGSQTNSHGFELYQRKMDGARVVKIPGGRFKRLSPPSFSSAERPPEGAFLICC
jgi:hypothetical protein